MEFNASKCEVLSVTNKRSPIVTNYILHGQALKIYFYNYELQLPTI